MTIDTLSFLFGLGIGAMMGTILIYLWVKKKLDANVHKIQQSASEIQVLRAKRQTLEEERHRLLVELPNCRQQLLEASKKISKLESDKKHLQLQAANQIADLRQIQHQMKDEFENMAHEILNKRAAEFEERQSNQLNLLLNPLKEGLKNFGEQVSNTYEKEARERLLLQKEIQQLLETNMQMAEDAQNLTRALKGDSKVQGNWGELVLAKILENSGLREGEEYIAQGKELNLRNADGRLQQPDVLILLPDKKHLVIDAKVSLVAYERYIIADDESKLLYLKQHIDSVLRHVKQLSEKHYQTNQKLASPDFVMLFMPIEAAFSEAIKARPDLFTEAWEQKIVLVSPTTLLATLKTVASVWKLEHQNQNAREIARQGGLLYDKLVAFAEEMEKLGRQLHLANKSWDDAMRKLKDGKGNLTDKAEKLRQLGISNRKKLPS